MLEVVVLGDAQRVEAGQPQRLHLRRERALGDCVAAVPPDVTVDEHRDSAGERRRRRELRTLAGAQHIPRRGKCRREVVAHVAAVGLGDQRDSAAQRQQRQREQQQRRGALQLSPNPARELPHDDACAASAELRPAVEGRVPHDEDRVVAIA